MEIIRHRCLKVFCKLSRERYSTCRLTKVGVVSKLEVPLEHYVLKYPTTSPNL